MQESRRVARRSLKRGRRPEMIGMGRSSSFSKEKWWRGGVAERQRCLAWLVSMVTVFLDAACGS